MTEIEFTEARCEERDGDIWLCIKPSSPARAHQFVFTKEMSRLIDGIVSECKDLGIETMTPEGLTRIKEAWGR